MSIKDIKLSSFTRTATIIFAEEQLSRKTETIKRKFVEAIFVLENNTPLSIQDIIDNLEDKLSIIFSENEVVSLVKDSNNFDFIASEKKSNDKYRLSEKRFRLLKSKEKNVINQTYDTFFSISNVDKKQFEDIMQRYLYYLLNTNIEAFNAIIKGSIPNNENLDNNYFSPEEIQIINNFLRWDNAEKDKALFALSSYCIEYSIVVNNSKESVLSSAIKNKSFYIDNALIYRALGINGKQRQRRTITFLKKCTQTGQNLLVSSISRKEFFDSVDYHINELKKTTPFGRINSKLFRKIAGSGIYSYYHEWKAGKLSYGFETFKANIKNQYNQLLETYHIKEDFKCPFNENDDNKLVNEYVDGIRSAKTWNGKSGNDKLHFWDAQNIYWIETLRANNNKKLDHTQYYFITSDLKLQSWDYNHATSCQPVTLLPSQWLALLLKYTSRSTDDYKSFVSFLNIPKESHTVSEDELQLMMAGISEITEDFQEQESLISHIFESDLENIIKGNVRENAKTFAKDKLEEKFGQILKEKEEEKANEISAFEIKLQKQETNFDKKIQDLKNLFDAELNKRSYEHDSDMLESLKNELQDKLTLQKIAMKDTDTFMGKIRFVIISPIVIVIIAWCIIVYKDWNEYEKWTYIVGALYTVLLLLYIMVHEKSIDIRGIYKDLYDSHYLKECQRNGISETEIEDLKSSIEILETKLKDHPYGSKQHNQANTEHHAL